MAGAREAARAAAPGAEALEHVDALHQFARYLTRDAALAEDLVQETFARYIASGREIAAGPTLKAWMFRILRNAFIDGYRRDKRDPARGGLDAEAASDEQLGDREPLRGDREIEHLRTVVAADIEAALQGLGQDARTVVLLDIEGFTETEIAGVLGCAVGTVKSRLSRARAALRVALGGYAR